MLDVFSMHIHYLNLSSIGSSKMDIKEDNTAEPLVI